MKIDKALISRLEHLARLELNEAEQQRLQADLNRILEMVARLDELPTDGVEPLVYVNEETEALRPDEPRPHLPREAAMKNAPQQDGQFFKVPKVIPKDK